MIGSRIWWPSPGEVRGEIDLDPDDYEDWQVEMLDRMRVNYKRWRDKIVPALEARRKRDQERDWDEKEKWAEENDGNGWV